MSRTLRFAIFTGSFALIVLPLLTPVQAQTQASCQFTTFSRIFTIPGGTPISGSSWRQRLQHGGRRHSGQY